MDLPVTRPLPDAELQGRLDALASHIGRLRADLAHGLETETIAHLLALGDILHRHDAFASTRLATAPTAPSPRIAIAAELAEDLRGIENQVLAWVARLDEKSRE